MDKLAQILANGVLGGGVYALVATGYALVYSVLRLVNFAHGGIVALGAFAALVAGQIWGPGIWPMAAATVLVGGGSGWLLERLAYRPLRRSPPLTALVTALGVAMIIENALAAVFGSDAHAVRSSNQFGSVVTLLGARVTVIQLAAFASAGLLLVGTWWLVHHSGIGRSMRAVADDTELALLSGIDVDRTVSRTFVIASSLGGVAGLIVALDVGCDPFMGTPIGFKAFVACVIGGASSFAGAIVGGLLLGVFESLIGGYVSTEFRDAIVMSVLIVLLLARPTGILRFGATRTN